MADRSVGSRDPSTSLGMTAVGVGLRRRPRAQALEREPFDYVVTSDFDLQFASDPARWAEYRDRWTEKVSGMSAQAQFGSVPCFLIPGVWRTNDERLVILKRNAE